MSADDGFGQRWGRNGEICVAVGLVTMAADKMVLLHVSIIGSMSNPREGPQGLCVNLVLQKRRYQPGLQRYRRTEMIWHF